MAVGPDLTDTILSQPMPLPRNRRPIKSLPTTTLGVIIGNREFFPDQLVAEAREEVLRLLTESGIRPIALSPNDSKLGGIETHGDARKCAQLFKEHGDEISGVVVVLPNFGDEKGVADTLKLAGLNVPVLIQGYPDDLNKLNPSRRRDAFCGKISVTNNLVQSGIKFSLTSKHVSHPTSASFEPASASNPRSSSATVSRASSVGSGHHERCRTNHSARAVRRVRARRPAAR